MLRTLRRDHKVRRLACEGGPILFRSVLELGMVDELNLTIAPYLFGGTNAPTLTGLSKEFLPASVHCLMKDMRIVGDECFLTCRIKSRHLPRDLLCRPEVFARALRRNSDKSNSSQP